MANYIYNAQLDPATTTARISKIVKRTPEGGKVDYKITHLRMLLKFPSAVPYIIQLLTIGGIWNFNCEPAFKVLVRCRVEQVCKINICLRYLTI